MSGLAGLYNLEGRAVDRQDLGRMMHALAHRGRDGSGVWCEGVIGLGQLARWSTPEAGGASGPTAGSDENLVVVADARLDNREELIRSLQLRQRPVTDAQLILAAYEKWGNACPERLVGDFVFAIWDQPNQHLFCARDQAGVKVLYYFHAPGKLFALGSEIKALLRLGEVPCQINETQVADYLELVFLNDTDTFYKDIYRLPAGHSLTVSREGVHLHRYWSLDPSHVLELDSDEAYAEAFLEQFNEAVRCRMQSGSWFGTLLSGGLDSSSITCAVRRLWGEREVDLPTFSLVYDVVKECDERVFINTVIEQGGFDPHFIPGDEIRPIDDLQTIINQLDEPNAGHSMSSVWKLYGAAAECGMRVVLDGHGGDETVSQGGEYVRQLARDQRWLMLARELGESARNGEITRRQAVKYYKDHLYKHGPRLLQVPRTAVRKIKQLRHGWSPASNGVAAGPNGSGGQKLITPDLAHRVRIDDRSETYKKEKSPASASDPQDYHCRTLTLTLQPWAMENYDKLGAVHGLEIRFPFRDKRLLEFCLSLPATQKRRLGWGRFVLRQAMEGILPPAIQWRARKNEFGPVLVRGIRSDNHEAIEAMLEHPGTLSDYVNLDRYRVRYKHITSPESAVSDQEWSEFLRVTGLAVWFQTIEARKVV